MSQFKRRHFLQLVSSAIATTTLGSCNTIQQQRRLEQNLSRGNSNRKLALLVGINKYPPNSQIIPLHGCLTDVELQRHLLIYRFGFNPKDIFTLTDAQATRRHILEAFETHLIEPAKPGDIVVFHYSGHGSQIADPDRDFPDGLNSTIVPFDSYRPAGNTGGIVQDITGHTLFLLMTALQTENVTVVLDCCHSGGAKRGNLPIRSVPGGVQFQASPEEKNYQQQWLSRLNLTPAEFKQHRQKGVAKGIVITATNRDQLAADYPFKDFSAGAFTYLMSQYFWQLPSHEPIAQSLPNIARSTSQISFTLQTPEFEVKPGSGNENKPLYFVEKLGVSAEAIITQINGSQVQLWLGGVEPQSLSVFDKEAIFAVVDARNQPVGRVQLESRQGLVGRGKLIEVAQPGIIQPGALCLEQVRVLPNNLALRIGLDASLGQETTIARTTLSTLPRLKVVPLQQGQIDYIFGRMTEAANQRDRAATTLPSPGSLGLFFPGFDALPGSFGAVGETVTDAIKRLQAKFKSLLAGHIIKMMLNSDASRLNVTASLSLVGQNNQFIAEVFPTRGVKKRAELSQRDRSATIISPDASKLPLGTAVVLRIANNEPRDLYISVLVIDAQGEITTIFPYQWTAPEEAARVGAGNAIAIPEPNDSSFELRTQEPKGLTEVLVIASITPLKKALKTLQTLARNRGQQQGAVTLNDPVEVIDDLLADLGEGNRSSTETNLRRIRTVSRISTTEFAAMSMTFEVI